MTGAILLKGGRIIDSRQKLDFIGSLLVKDSKIVWLGKDDSLPTGLNYDTLNAAGLVVCPGFIDLHCHLRDPGFPEKETIATGTRAAARGGFTTVCCMPNTNPPLDNEETIDYVKSTAIKEGLIRVLPIACVTKGRTGKELVDMKKLARLGIAGFSDDGDPVKTAELMLQALTTCKELNLPVIDHCEELIGGPAQGEEKIIARDLKLAEDTGGWIHIAHVSTRGSVDLIRKAKENGVRVTSEVTPHHLTMTQDAINKYGTMAKVNPPLRTEDDCRALIAALKDGVIDVIATDHAPHTADDKQLDFASSPSGISGFETAFGNLMRLVYRGKLTLPEVIACLTDKPARILGGRFGDLGSLATNSVADIIIIDPDVKWIVDTTQFASKGKNTPLIGQKLKGKILATISQGKLVYQDDSLEIGLNKQ